MKWRAVILGSSLGLVLGGCATPGAPGKAAGLGDAESLLAVDCLLPGQVRQLGQRQTYLTPRRPIKTTAGRCELRGGEYVAFDEANFATALKIWLPQAESGSADAQTHVGEIFEQGLGIPPDYETAASWYRKAAEQGNSRARINLGHLYETGLGVPQDMSAAVNLYRQASGLTSGEFEYVSPEESARRVAATAERLQLRQDVRDLEKELEQSEKRYQTQQQRLDSERASLQSLRATVEADRQRLLASESAMPDARDATRRLKLVQALEQRLDNARRQRDVLADRLAALQTANAERDAIEAANNTLETQRQALENLQAERDVELAGYREQIDRLEQQLAAGRNEQSRLTSRVREEQLDRRGEQQETAVRLAGLERELQQREAQIAQQNTQLASAAAELARQRTALAERASSPEQNQLAGAAIDADGSSPGLLTRGASSSQSDDKGAAAAARDNDENDRRALRKIDLGRYYALVIGNNQYPHLQNLNTAENDARQIAEVLSSRYGFETELLINADRLAVLQAIDRLRGRLTEQDNLVIYYAGHGEIDTETGKGYWLPVEAQPDNRDRWLSNAAITGLIDTLPAKHVLVVADSCYSGTLTGSSVVRPPAPAQASSSSSDAPPTEALREQWLSAISASKVRAVLSSGGVKPVYDGSPTTEHSLFAAAFLDMLTSNNSVLEGYALFASVQQNVSAAARELGVQQDPQYAPIRHAGHEAGEFLFVPRPLQAAAAALSSPAIMQAGIMPGNVALPEPHKVM